MAMLLWDTIYNSNVCRWSFCFLPPTPSDSWMTELVNKGKQAQVGQTWKGLSHCEEDLEYF